MAAVIYGSGAAGREYMEFVRRSQGCSLCEKQTEEDNPVYFPVSTSRYAHISCYNAIKPAIEKLMLAVSKINELCESIGFKFTKEQQKAAYEGVFIPVKNEGIIWAELMKTARQDAGQTISSYQEQHGIPRLTLLICTACEKVLENLKEQMLQFAQAQFFHGRADAPDFKESVPVSSAKSESRSKPLQSLTKALVRGIVFGGMNLDRVKELLQQGADPNARDDVDENGFRCPLIIWAVRRGDLPLYQALKDAGADPTVKDNEGCSAYYWAKRHDHLDKFNFLSQ